MQYVVCLNHPLFPVQTSNASTVSAWFSLMTGKCKAKKRQITSKILKYMLNGKNINIRATRTSNQMEKIKNDIIIHNVFLIFSNILKYIYLSC